MQIQQLARAIDGGTATTATQYPSTTFLQTLLPALSPSLLRLVISAFNDDNSLWRGVSTSAGDWVLVAPGLDLGARGTVGNLGANGLCRASGKGWRALRRALCLGYWEENRMASVSIIRNGATNIFSADVDLPKRRSRNPAPSL